jgi:dihydropteroate synthase
MTTYFRPLALVFGRDAKTLIAEGRAGALGGLPHIGFTQVEVIQRGEKPVLFDYQHVEELPQVKAITVQRPSFGGLAMDRCHVMGIVNVTPDSFSDGGKLMDAEAAVAHGRQLAQEGAAILDVGGESTRPGSDAVSIESELSRVIGVVKSLSTDHPVSCDTRKAPVMQAALNAGACVINDVSALSYDAKSADVISKAKVPVILMHAQGEPKTMQLNPRYEDVVLDVYDDLAKLVAAAEAAGIARDNICIDPGIGFGKTFKQNLELMAGLTVFHGLGLPMLVGLSRKGFVGAVTRENAASDRIYGSVGGALQAARQGAHILRVHDVKATVQALSMFTQSDDPDSADL